jgi:uncharacterized membrane protein SpoIIM required for sporulation
VDLDVYVAAHRAEWTRLEQLVKSGRRPRRLAVGEVDELVELYQRTATHLSVVQSAGRDAVLVARLSQLIARARSVIAGSRQPAWRDAVRFLQVDFPAAVYRTRYWWLACAAAFLLVAFAVGFWVEGSPQVQRALGDPDEIQRLVNNDFEAYYSSAPAHDFALRVWTNNALVSAQALLFGVLLGVPVVFVLLNNAVNVGVSGGLLAAYGKGELFWGLILPHGILELTAVFVACGLGLKLGWTVVDPGRRTRGTALAEEGRSLVTGAVGLVVVLFVSGLIEAFVTPSGLPTWARITIGVLAEVAFLAWIFVLGRRAVLAGRTGDLVDDLRGDSLPTA